VGGVLEELMVCKKPLARDVFYTRGEGRYRILIENGLLLESLSHGRMLRIIRTPRWNCLSKSRRSRSNSPDFLNLCGEDGWGVNHNGAVREVIRTRRPAVLGLRLAYVFNRSESKRDGGGGERRRKEMVI
jgi:hypothetical protein